MGTVGDITITPKDFSPCIANRALAIIRNIKEVSPQYLFIYLITHNAFREIERLKIGGVQQRINLDALRKFDIPVLSNEFQKQIENITVLSYKKRSSSKQLYTKAETLLLDTLGLANFSPSTEKINIKSLKDSFGTTGRLDAEYYQKKYEGYLDHIFTYADGWKKLGEVCNLKDINYHPINDNLYKYIELSDIDNFGGINSYTTETGEKLPSRARRKIQLGDVLISSIEGSLSSCAIVSQKTKTALCSTGFFVINSKYINAETLLVLFKCVLMQNVLKQMCSGTILTAINKADFLNVPLSLIDSTTQIKIATLIQESFLLKAESERLLEVAKRSVEIAIEQDEKAAMTFLQQATKQQITHNK